MHPFSTSNVKQIQHSLSIKELKCGNSHPKIVGCHESFRQFRLKDSESIFSWSNIGLAFALKKKTLNLNRVKDQEGRYIIDMDLVDNQGNDYLEVDSGGDDFEDQCV